MGLRHRHSLCGCVGCDAVALDCEVLTFINIQGSKGGFPGSRASGRVGGLANSPVKSRIKVPGCK